MNSISCRSANSNSKRSRHSNSSNTSNSKRSKNSNQKTLGAAWGSNSLSSSRSSSRRAPFSDFGSYMAVKNQKLQEQFQSAASTSSHCNYGSDKPIFCGVSIFVDGFTIPSSQELRGYMLKHGGCFENYFLRHRVTHIICSNLPNSKLKNLRSFSRGLPVVKPTWILDSVAANKLLSWVPYQLDQLTNEEPDQPKLSDFFILKKGQRSTEDSYDSTCMLESKVEYSESTLCGMDNGNSFGIGNPCVRESNDSSIIAPNKQELTCCDQEIAPLEVAKPCFDGTRNNACKGETGSSAQHPSTSASSLCPVDNSFKESQRSLTDQQSYHRHSMAEDPDFVENYFKSSRLHFIGTWRQRYRKRFLSMSGGVKDKNYDAGSSAAAKRTTVIHIDMDCFFVAVAVRNHPELLDKPVAVCHSDSPIGTAEISSANYPARDYGVRAGMFVRDAKAVCPHLVVVPYNFKAYEEVADRFYEILHKYCSKVQAVSCDEAFLEITDIEEKDPEVLASDIRKEIFEATRCTASAGISGNLLMARLATRSAKPDGQCYLPPEKVDEYLSQLPVKALPGIGRVLEEKLKKRQVLTCGQLRMLSKESLQKDFGVRTGEMLWNYSRGVDNRMVGIVQESKSIGADVNWGVRFRDLKDSHHFLLRLCEEVSLRLQGSGLQGRTFTLKIKKRKKDAGEPSKYMGCGDCENLSHSTTIPVATDEVEVLRRITMQLFGYFHIDVKDIRGVGLQASKLESSDYPKQGLERNALRSWLSSATEHTKEKQNSDIPAEDRADGGQSAGSSQYAALPSLHDLDIDVIQSLPPELISEMNDMYGGKLTALFEKKKGKVNELGGSMCSTVQQETAEEQANDSRGSHIKNMCKDDLPGCSKDMEIQSASNWFEGPQNISSYTPESVNFELMPSSLSQVDTSILLQLPEEVRADIVGQLPAHRKSNQTREKGKTSLGATGSVVVEDNDKMNEHPLSEDNFWKASPPHWVDKFKSSNCSLLNILGETYNSSVFSGQLSSILQPLICRPQAIVNVNDYEMDEATNSLYELVKQYIKLKMETDIEELYICFRLLKRLSLKSNVFLHVVEVLCPYLQASVTEVYGGNLNILF